MKLIHLTGTVVGYESAEHIIDNYYEVQILDHNEFLTGLLAKSIGNHDYLLECTGVELSSFVDARKQQQGPGDRQSGGSKQVSVSTLDVENLPTEPNPSNKPGYLGCYSDQAR